MTTARERFLLYTIAGLMLLGALPASLAAAEETPEPITTGDPEIPTDHLKLLVKPLTREEVAVEAEAWRGLLKAKVEEISDLQIGVKRQREEVATIQEEVEEIKQQVAKTKQKVEQAGQDEPGVQEPGRAAADAQQAVEAAEDAAATAEQASDVAQEAAAKVEQSEKAEEKRAELTTKLPELQEEQAKLIDRLNVVLNDWEAKGGEVEEYRQYVLAVSGLDLDVTDAATTWTAIWGWMTSEQGGLRWVWNVLKFTAIVAAFYVLAMILSALTNRAAARIKGASELLRKFLADFVWQLVMIVGVIIAISALELNISPLLAAIGGAAFVIGLALQGTLSNFASGLIILGYRPFDVGDVIDAAGISGIVDSMNLISTKIRTFDNKVMIVPNNKIAGDIITNATASETRRVDMVFGIGYQDDIEKAKGILESLLKEHELTLDDPAPVVKLNELGDSSVNFICRPWVKSGDYWTVYWDITRQVKEEFDRQGISIPFPQQDVHVYQQSASPGQDIREAQTAS